MSNTRPSGAEVLYEMPAVGATKTTTTQSIVSGNSSGNGAYQLPALSSIWPVDVIQGKSMHVQAGGTYDAGAVTNAMVLAYDPTQGTIGTTIAATGAFTIPSTTTGSWLLDLWLDCMSVGNNTSGWSVSGSIKYGVSNNAATAAASEVMMGGAQTAGVPNLLALATSASIGYIELWSTFGTAPTAFVCSSFKIFGLN